MEYLSGHKTRMQNEGLKTGKTDLVFVDTAGGPVSATNLTRCVFKPLLAVCEFSPEIRIHDLRHSHATLLLSRGVNPKVVQERLGHEFVKTTLDLYSHVLPTSQREAATIVSTALFAKKSLISSLTTNRAEAA